MKKWLVLLLTLMLIVFTGCNNSDNGSKATDNRQDSSTEETTQEEVEPSIMFENGTLEADDFTLTIKSTEVIQSPMEDNPGLFVTFTLTNKTEDTDVVPNDVLIYLAATQVNETSRVDLSSNYYFLDAFGSEDDVDTYNKMVDLDNASSNALLPGKTVDFVEAYTLDNDSEDVTFTGLDPVTSEPVGEYVVTLK